MNFQHQRIKQPLGRWWLRCGLALVLATVPDTAPGLWRTWKLRRLVSYVGLLAGGGLKEFAVRASTAAGPGGDVFAELKIFETVAMAKVSNSAVNAGTGSAARRRQGRLQRLRAAAHRQGRSAQAGRGRLPPAAAGAAHRPATSASPPSRCSWSLAGGRFVSPYDYGSPSASPPSCVAAGRSRRAGGRGVAAQAGAPALRRAGPAGEDPGPHRPHAEDRQAAAELSPSPAFGTFSPANPGRRKTKFSESFE